jgi:urease accessory protein
MTSTMTTTTRIEVGPDGVRFTHGPLHVRPLRGAGCRIGLVAGQALLLAGDAVRVEVEVVGPVDVEVVEVGGTVAYDMRGGAATWDVGVTLAGGAALTWDAQPFVVAAGAEVERRTTVMADAGSRATLRETLVLGRCGETGGTLRSRTRVGVGGVPLVVEDLDLSPSARGGWAVLGPHRCLDTLTAVGHRLPDGPDVLQLDGCGSLRRWVGDDLHRSPLEGSGA